MVYRNQPGNIHDTREPISFLRGERRGTLRNLKTKGKSKLKVLKVHKLKKIFKEI